MQVARYTLVCRWLGCTIGRLGKVIHRLSAMGLFLCVTSDSIHTSVCVGVRERFTSSPDVFELIRFVMESLLQVGRIQELDVSFPFERTAFRRLLFHRSLHKSFQFFPHEVTAPSYECSARVIVMLEFVVKRVT